MVEIKCGKCEKTFSVSVEMWWGAPEALPRVLLCPHCKAWNVVAFALRMEVKHHGIVLNK